MIDNQGEQKKKKVVVSLHWAKETKDFVAEEAKNLGMSQSAYVENLVKEASHAKNNHREL